MSEPSFHGVWHPQTESSSSSDFHVSIRRIGVIGSSFKSSPISIREELARNLTIKKIVELKSKQEDKETELVLLSTCNRSEVYYYQRTSSSKLAVELETLFGQYTTSPSHTYELSGLFAIKHLMDVACGLDSLVVGEEQILSQVREASKLSSQHGLAGPILSKLFSNAYKTGSKVREANPGFVGGQHDSISSAVLELVSEKFPKEYRPNLLLVGSGGTAKLTLEKIDKSRFGTVVVAARNLKFLEQENKADELVPLSELGRIISEKKIDAIITATSAENYVVVEEQLNSRPNPLLIVDISAPRNVDPSVGLLPNVELLNLDDLRGYVRPLEQVGEEIISRINEEITVKTMEFMGWMVEYEEILPLLSSIRRRAEMIRAEELNNAFSRAPNLSDEQKAVVNKMSERLVRRLLHDPSIKLKELLKGDDLGRAAQFGEAILSLFSSELVAREKAATTPNDEE